MPQPTLHVEVWTKERTTVQPTYVVDDCEYVSFINSGTFGIPGSGGKAGPTDTITKKITDGYKVLFINTEMVDHLTIERDDA